MSRRLFRILSIALALGGMAAGAALASGGGGGGGGGGSMGPSTSSGRQIDPAAAYSAAVTALNAHDYRTAIRNFRDVLSVAPDHPESNYGLGVAYIGNGQARQARRPLETAVRSANAPADAHLQLGLLYLQMNDREHAVERENTLTQLLADCAAPACTDTRRAQLQAAHDALDQALNPPAAAAPEQPAAPTTGWNFPSTQEGRAAYADAVGLINQAKYEEALAALDRASAAVGPHPDILNYEGFASRKLGRYDAAFGYYHAALAINPEHLGANEYLGELYLELGQIPEARAQLARLDQLCAYGCVEREELARWIALASN